METIHHALLSIEYLRKKNIREPLMGECVACSMLPDIVQAESKEPIRPRTHLEVASITGELHHTRDDLSEIFFYVPSFTEAHTCPIQIGTYLHLVQDKAYDKWISSWVEQIGDGKDVPFSYFLHPSGEPLAEEDVKILKRYSWKIGLDDGFAREGICQEQRSGWIESNIVSALKEAPIVTKKMISYLRKNYALADTLSILPPALALYEKEIENTFLDMLSSLREDMSDVSEESF